MADAQQSPRTPAFAVSLITSNGTIMRHWLTIVSAGDASSPEQALHYAVREFASNNAGFKVNSRLCEAITHG